MQSNTISQEEIDQAAATLAKLEAGFLPLPIFLQTTRLMVTSALELVPLRRNLDGAVEVLLTQREDEDEHWSGMWHNPGVVIRPTDESYPQALRRIYTTELGYDADEPGVFEPVFVDTILHRTRRGREIGRVYWLELPARPPRGQYFLADKLPDRMIESHVAVVGMAVDAYKAHLFQI